MKPTYALPIAALVVAFAAPSPALAGEGCDWSNKTTTIEAKKATPQAITVEKLAVALQPKAPEQFTVYDANSEETRQRYGVIPGARLLPHYSKYEPQKELPADKAANVVFYCSSQRCSAAPAAAEKATEAGYENVFVLKAGIKGWTEAGKAVSKLRS